MRALSVGGDRTWGALLLQMLISADCLEELAPPAWLLKRDDDGQTTTRGSFQYNPWTLFISESIKQQLYNEGPTVPADKLGDLHLKNFSSNLHLHWIKLHKRNVAS